MAPPLGPRVRPRIVTDEEGTYAIYPDLRCAFDGCGIQLTSRNRYQHRSLCQQHGRDGERERARRRYAEAKHAQGKPKAARREAAPEFIRIADPAWRKAHAALSRWLALPTDPEAYKRLQAALVDHELAHRLMQLLPWMPTPQALPSIPFEEPVFDNPDHRTTRLEFLADADYYGV